MRHYGPLPILALLGGQFKAFFAASYRCKMVLRRINLRPRALGASGPRALGTFGFPILILHYLFFQLHSEYKSTYRWHELTPRPQGAVVKQAPARLFGEIVEYGFVDGIFCALQ